MASFDLAGLDGAFEDVFNGHLPFVGLTRLVPCTASGFVSARATCIEMFRDPGKQTRKKHQDAWQERDHRPDRTTKRIRVLVTHPLRVDQGQHQGSHADQ